MKQESDGLVKGIIEIIFHKVSENKYRLKSAHGPGSEKRKDERYAFLV